MDSITKDIIETYKKRAKRYNLTANLYYIFGFREYAYRKKAIESLGLKKGDHVLDICCGTGLNFPILQHHIGSEGHITGVDISHAMLEQADRKIKKRKWRNITLIQGDVKTMTYPQSINAAFSSFGLAFVPEYEKVIRKVYNLLPLHGRFGELGITTPKNWLRFLKPIVLWVISPFGNPSYYIDVRIWESVKKIFDYTTIQTFYGGITYNVTGYKEKKEQE